MNKGKIFENRRIQCEVYYNTFENCIERIIFLENVSHQTEHEETEHQWGQ